MINKLLISVFLVVGMGACKHQAAKSALTLGQILQNQPEWLLISIGDMELQKRGFEEPPYIVFNTEQNTLSAYAGCNRIFARYEIRGDNLMLSRIGSTRMMCRDMEAENALLGCMAEGCFLIEKKSSLLVMLSSRCSINIQKREQKY